MKKLIVIFFFTSSFLSFSQDNSLSEKEKLKEYRQKEKEAFKKENFWYKMWNGYQTNPGFSKYAIGYAFTKPSKGWSDVKQDFGIRYRRNHLDISAAFWKGIPDGKTTIEDGVRLSLGYTTPVGWFSIGNRYLDVKGFLIQPAFSTGYVYDNKNHGLYVAPGLHLQLPFSIIEARANIDYTIGGGFNIYPEISLQLDALRTLFDPKLTKTGTLYTSSTTATPLGGGWYSVSHYSSSEPFAMKDVGPFWALTPRYGAFAIGDSYKPYYSYGLGISGRINFFTGDIYFKKANMQIGVQENSYVDDYARKNFDNKKVNGMLSTNEVTFEGGLNIVGLFLALLKPATVQHMEATTTPLNRLNFHIGFTYIMPGATDYEDKEGAEAYTKEFFIKKPDIKNNSKNNPLMHQNEWGVNFGTSLELGAVAIKSTYTTSVSNGSRLMVELYYMLPLTKLKKVYGKNPK